MTHEYSELLEQTAFEMVVQAFEDYHITAAVVFRHEADLPQDRAEDLTREALESMRLPQVNERLYGKVDYKKAIYVFLPKAVPVALMVDSKAEKANGDRTATLQMSQTSMRVKLKSGNKLVDKAGRLPSTIECRGLTLYVVTIVVKYVYDEWNDNHILTKLILACIPNIELQQTYNPNAQDTIWLAGKDSPKRNEDFRIRLSFERLSQKAAWRVRTINIAH